MFTLSLSSPSYAVCVQPVGIFKIFQCLPARLLNLIKVKNYFFFFFSSVHFFSLLVFEPVIRRVVTFSRGAEGEGTNGRRDVYFLAFPPPPPPPRYSSVMSALGLSFFSFYFI